ncbi:hypothetical protein [Mycolicibacterium grossiae]|uniref:Uncharacterized protein n=1 Tax=Mycolicibacterium grossiae TaxID=1552759 RepID=A0A1E8Q379_9MYCO|nr:hypothetical protein [Mycolicibacterium grossiae]OFJ53068.1 hypothetical protein BEL07_14330 [Mycolicibacterium grossiae]QEM46881.1 hypothetical protein FZ046_20755 [Mycolicibacterium grossiae]
MSESDWQVVAATAHNPGDPADGAAEEVLARSDEAEARRVYTDTVATAAEHGYAWVTLRAGDREVDRWPAATGWTV